MKGRIATAAHPLCTCREHDHQLDRCLGPEFTYRRPDGTEYQGTCRILGGVEPRSREACVMHGDRSQPAAPAKVDASGRQPPSAEDAE